MDNGSGPVRQRFAGTGDSLTPAAKHQEPSLCVLPEATRSHSAGGGALAGPRSSGLWSPLAPLRRKREPPPPPLPAPNGAQGSPTRAQGSPTGIGPQGSTPRTPGPAWREPGVAASLSSPKCATRPSCTVVLGGRWLPHSEADGEGAVSPVGCHRPLSLTTTAPCEQGPSAASLSWRRDQASPGSK